MKPATQKSAAKVVNGRVTRIEREVLSLKRQCKQLRDGQSFMVPIETLAPEPFVLKRSFHVVVSPSDGEFTATFFDANIGMSGDTAEEAVRNLKTVIVDTLEQFEQKEAILGPEPARQLAVLREFIQRQT
jgi:hypothetical protein